MNSPLYLVLAEINIQNIPKSFQPSKTEETDICYEYIYIYISHSGDTSKAARNILKGLAGGTNADRHLKNMVVLY